MDTFRGVAGRAGLAGGCLTAGFPEGGFGFDLTFVIFGDAFVGSFGGTLINDADAGAARTTLGLGTAAITAATAYATAAQGATADSALQAETITLATLKSVTAASADFADFQTRIAAL